MAPDETERSSSAKRSRSKKAAEGDASGPLPELLRRAMATGLAGFFTTEEAIRKALGDTVPQDWVDFAALQSDRTRAEFLDRLGAEFGRVLENVDLVELAESILEDRTIELNATIRLAPRAPGGDMQERRSSVKVTVEEASATKPSRKTPTGEPSKE
jgi:hypothetical protein